MKRFIFIATLTLAYFSSSAQVSPKDSAVFSPLITVAYSFNWPGGDLVSRFGANSTIGGGLSFKTRSNYVFGIGYNYIFGNNVKESGILEGLATTNGFIIADDGTPAKINMTERGYSLFAKFGKVLSVLPFTDINLGPNPNCGVFVRAGGGLLQHKIHIESNALPLQKDYVKGYDRLTNGFALTEFIGYFYLSSNRLINFYIGMECIQGWTQNRRGYNYDTMEEDNTPRLDTMTGFKFGWVLPLYKKVPDEFYYD